MRIAMGDHEIVDSSFTAIINAPLGKVDIPKMVLQPG
jgi:hypothetical protein